MKLLKSLPALLCCSAVLCGQAKTDSATEKPGHKDAVYRPEYKKLIIPTVLIGYGVVSLTSDALKDLNRSTKYEIGEHQPRQIKLDNYTQYLPAALVYGYNLTGMKGKHSLRDRTVIYGTSQLIAAAIVLPLKHAVKEERPDGSNSLSFPSGHTTTAFSSAQFLFREYKDENIWLALSGYPLAVFTGIYRTLNDKHWVGDVVAGAGFGILSTELSYWLFPVINKMLTGRNMSSTALIYPLATPDAVGAGVVLSF